MLSLRPAWNEDWDPALPNKSIFSKTCVCEFSLFYFLHSSCFLSRGEMVGETVETWRAVAEGVDMTVEQGLTSDTVAFRCTQWWRHVGSSGQCSICKASSWLCRHCKRFIDSPWVFSFFLACFLSFFSSFSFLLHTLLSGLSFFFPSHFFTGIYPRC